MISAELLNEVLNDKTFFTIGTLNDYQVWEVLCLIRQKHDAVGFYNFFSNVAQLAPEIEGRLWKIYTKTMPDCPGRWSQFNWALLAPHERSYNGQELEPGKVFNVECDDTGCSSHGDKIEILDIKAWETPNDPFDVRFIAKLTFGAAGPSSRGGIYSAWMRPHELGNLLRCWAHSGEF